MTETAIRIENLTKCYRIGLKEELSDTFVGMLTAWVKAPIRNYRRLKRLSIFDDVDKSGDIVWALKNISFEVKEGEVVGIVGRNGAGKSTLLKVLSRITEPTSGRAVIHGRVSSLLEVGTGFHPDLTGRENVYLNGTILGMTKQEVDRKFDEIVAFSEIERFIDTPVKRYSSGMRVRLAFSVAAHLDPEILLIDEVLAVGDTAFQKKCVGKMGNVAKEGRTVLFVSHNMVAIAGLCQRAILLQDGKALVDGPSEEVIQHYMKKIRTLTAATPLDRRTDRQGNGTIRLVEVNCGLNDNPASGYWLCGDEAILDLRYRCKDGYEFNEVEVAVGVRTLMDTPLLYFSTRVTKEPMQRVQGFGIFRCRIPRIPLEPGQYLLNIEIKHAGVKTDHVMAAANVEVVAGDFYQTGVMSTYGGVACTHTWSNIVPGG